MQLIINFSIIINTDELIYRYYPICPKIWKTGPIKGRLVCNMSENAFDKNR